MAESAPVKSFFCFIAGSKVTLNPSVHINEVFVFVKVLTGLFEEAEVMGGNGLQYRSGAPGAIGSERRVPGQTFPN